MLLPGPLVDRILLTGATGFVGSHLKPRLEAAGLTLRCATRDAARVARQHGREDWVVLDVNNSETLVPAMQGARAAIYLVHGMSGGAGYEERESAAARNFAAAAARAGLERIVYLGGVAPDEHPSRHLRSRLTTGRLLRRGPVPVFELRASMIIGHGSTSFRIVRDLATRLPAMLLPKWLGSRTQPVAIDDVVEATAAALTLPIKYAGVYDLPGPDTLTAKEILLHIAALRGMRPVTLNVPLFSTHLASYWLKLITGADYRVARELVEGLSGDLLASGVPFWSLLPDHPLVPFDAAARRAMIEEEMAPAHPTIERAAALMSRAPRGAAG